MGSSFDFQLSILLFEQNPLRLTKRPMKQKMKAFPSFFWKYVV